MALKHTHATGMIKAFTDASNVNYCRAPIVDRWFAACVDNRVARGPLMWLASSMGSSLRAKRV